MHGQVLITVGAVFPGNGSNFMDPTTRMNASVRETNLSSTSSPESARFVLSSGIRARGRKKGDGKGWSGKESRLSRAIDTSKAQGARNRGKREIPCGLTDGRKDGPWFVRRCWIASVVKMITDGQGASGPRVGATG